MADEEANPGFNLDNLSSGLTLNQVFELDEQLTQAQPRTGTGASLSMPANPFLSQLPAQGNQALRYERPKAPTQKGIGTGGKVESEEKVEQETSSDSIVFRSTVENGEVCWIERDTPFAKFLLMMGDSVEMASIAVRINTDFWYQLSEEEENCVRFTCTSDTIGVHGRAKYDSVQGCQALLRVLMGIHVYMGWQTDPVVCDPAPSGKRLAEGDIVGLSFSLWKLSPLNEPFVDPGKHKFFESQTYSRLTLGSLRAKDLVGIDDSSVAKVEHLLQGRCKGSWSLNVVKRRGEQFILLMNVVKVKHSNSKPKDTLPAADVVRSEPGEISGQLEEIQRKLDILLQRSDVANGGAPGATSATAIGANMGSTGATVGPIKVENSGEELKEKVKQAFTESVKNVSIDASKTYTGEEVISMLKHILKGALRSVTKPKK